MKLRYIIGLTLLIGILACTRSTVDTSLQECDIVVAYTVADSSNGDLEVKSIIDNSCAYSGCHDGGNAPRNLTMFGADMESITLDSDKFKSRIFEIGDMPPDTISESRKLNQNDLQTLECWITGGYLNQG